MDKSERKSGADFTLQAAQNETTVGINREAPVIEVDVSTPQTGMSKNS